MFVTFEHIDNELTRFVASKRVFYTVFSEEDDDYALFEQSDKSLYYHSSFDDLTLVLRHLQLHYGNEK